MRTMVGGEIEALLSRTEAVWHIAEVKGRGKFRR